MKEVKLMLGDNMKSLKELEDNSVDSVVTDPPYSINFMSKSWDSSLPSIEFWSEVYRVLKPGGHILSFGGTRTYHRMVVNLEDAGFEVRDTIAWHYGSGFPKSLNIGKAIDKLECNDREVISIETRNENHSTFDGIYEKEYKRTKGHSKYEGYGTALKPATELICLARKPLSEKTVAQNVLKWGVGGLNIDGCRIGNDIIQTNILNTKGGIYNNDCKNEMLGKKIQEGRFTANVIFDEYTSKLLDEQSGYSKTKKNDNYKFNKVDSDSDIFTGRGTYTPREDEGGASRFFYVAKASKKERNLGINDIIEINTPTIKLIGEIIIHNNKIDILWEKEEKQITLADMDKLHQKVIEEFGVEQNIDKLWNIELFGKRILEKFQKDAKYIIKMEMDLTTIFQTLNVLIQQNIKEDIAEQLNEMMVGIKYVENAETKNTKVYFTNLKKDGSNQNVNVVSLNEVLSLSVRKRQSHPTQKPIKLMTYLVRLITPKNGIVLDPYMGSGSTGVAAIKEDFNFIGMEMDADYFKIAEARIEHAKNN